MKHITKSIIIVQTVGFIAGLAIAVIVLIMTTDKTTKLIDDIGHHYMSITLKSE